MSRRDEFPRSVKLEALERSGGICECHLIPHVFEVFCGLSLGVGNTYFEHVLPDNISAHQEIEWMNLMGNVA